MFSFLAKQELARKWPLDAGPSKPPEPAMEFSTEAPSHPRLQTLFREMHSGNVYPPRGTKHSSNAPLLSKATLAFFSPSHLVSIPQKWTGLPLAAWALLLCWWSPEFENHYKCFSFKEKQELAGKSLLDAGPTILPEPGREFSPEDSYHSRIKMRF